jgi:hypothetical protein
VSGPVFKNPEERKMKVMNRVLLVASLGALTFFIFASPVAAFDGGFNGTEVSLAEDVCEDIGDSDSTTVDGWLSFNAVGYTDKQCKTVCKSVRRTCDKAVKTNVECHERMDKIQKDAWKTVCKVDYEGDSEDTKGCQSGVKEDYNRNKEGIKLAEADERDDCEDLQNACLLECPDILFDIDS